MTETFDKNRCPHCKGQLRDGRCPCDPTERPFDTYDPADPLTHWRELERERDRGRR